MVRQTFFRGTIVIGTITIGLKLWIQYENWEIITKEYSVSGEVGSVDGKLLGGKKHWDKGGFCLERLRIVSEGRPGGDGGRRT